jgi:hypothetical protein
MVVARRSHRWLVELDSSPSQRLESEPWLAATNVKNKTFWGREKAVLGPGAIVSPELNREHTKMFLTP